MIRLINSKIIANLHFFSNKKAKDAGILKISKFKLNENTGSHLIYSSSRGKSFQTIGIGMACGVLLSLGLYQIDTRWANFVPFLMCISALIVYQIRMSKTIREIAIDKYGQNLRIITFGILGSNYLSRSYEVPIYIMKGVVRKTLNRGVIIKGGGSFGYKQINFYFNQDGILDKTVFDHVIGGRGIKYTDTL